MYSYVYMYMHQETKITEIKMLQSSPANDHERLNKTRGKYYNHIHVYVHSVNINFFLGGRGGGCPYSFCGDWYNWARLMSTYAISSFYH